MSNTVSSIVSRHCLPDGPGYGFRLILLNGNMEVKRESAVRSMVRGDLAIDEYNPCKSLDCPRQEPISTAQGPHKGDVLLLLIEFCRAACEVLDVETKHGKSLYNVIQTKDIRLARRIIFHGVSKNAYEGIRSDKLGFDIKYFGKNGQAYENGLYFGLSVGYNQNNSYPPGACIRGEKMDETAPPQDDNEGDDLEKLFALISVNELDDDIERA